MPRLTLDKRHKLCSKIAVDRLFQDGSHSAMAYPLRAVWRENPGREKGNGVQFLITIPKKRLRLAVDRVKMRRRVREAYRLSRHAHMPASSDTPVDIAFIYVAGNLAPYHVIDRSMNRLLSRIFPPEACKPSGSAPSADTELPQ